MPTELVIAIAALVSTGWFGLPLLTSILPLFLRLAGAIRRGIATWPGPATKDPFSTPEVDRLLEGMGAPAMHLYSAYLRQLVGVTAATTVSGFLVLNYYFGWIQTFPGREWILSGVGLFAALLAGSLCLRRARAYGDDIRVILQLRDSRFDAQFYAEVERSTTKLNVESVLFGIQETGQYTSRVFFKIGDNEKVDNSSDDALARMAAYLSANMPVAAHKAGLTCTRCGEASLNSGKVKVATWTIEGHPKPVTVHKLLYAYCDSNFVAFVGHLPESDMVPASCHHRLMCEFERVCGRVTI